MATNALVFSVHWTIFDAEAQVLKQYLYNSGSLFEVLNKS